MIGPSGVHQVKTVPVAAAADGANVVVAGQADRKLIVVAGALQQVGAAASDLRSSGGTVLVTIGAAGVVPLDDVWAETAHGEGLSTNNGVGSDLFGWLAYIEIRR